MKNLVRIVLALVTTALLASCNHGEKNYPQENGFLQEPNDFVLQFDDNGKIRDPAVAARALSKIAHRSETQNTIVLLFVHGWHHNAAVDDENMVDFAKTLAKTRATLNDDLPSGLGIYSRSRQMLTGDSNVDIIGIYIGWRGQSLPMPLNHLTFWGRKRTAEIVGNGDLRNFLIALQDIYTQRSQARLASDRAPFMGMVSFGHSFGGQVLFRAVSETIRKELASQKQGPLLGFGDLTVLVNPALEAGQYEPIHQLARRRTFSPAQPPVLLVLSSEGDSARKWLFPAARAVGFSNRNKNSEEDFGLWGKSLGEYEPHRTHSITVDIESPPPSSSTPVVEGLDISKYADDPCFVAAFDLSARRRFSNVLLKPLGQNNFNPFIVAYTDNNLILRHSGIFKDSLRAFINDFVAITESKRMFISSLPKTCPRLVLQE